MNAVFLVDDLLTLPFRGLLMLFQEIHKQVEQELYDEAHLMEQLAALEMYYEMEELTEEEYREAEAVLLERLELARTRNMQFEGE